MKKVLILLQLFACLHNLYAQGNDVDHKKVETTSQLLKMLQIPRTIDSLKGVLNTNVDNETRALILFQLTTSYINSNLDSSLKYIKEFNQVASKSKQLQGNGLVIMGDIFLRLGNTSLALELLFKGSKIFEEMKDSAGLGMAYWNIGKVYQSLGDNANALQYYSNSVKIASAAKERIPQAFSMGFLGLLYMNMNRLDSALHYTRAAYVIRKQMNDQYSADLQAQLGDIYRRSDSTNLAMQYYRMASEEGLSKYNFRAAAEASIGIAMLLYQEKKTDSCYYYARNGFDMAQQLKNAALITKASNFLKTFFKEKNILDSAFQYQEVEISARDTMLSLEKIYKVKEISIAEQQSIMEKELQHRDLQTKIRQYVLIIVIAVILFVAIVLYRNNNQKQKVNILLQQQKAAIEHALTELKSTQSQLIQSEKMASLGELTAGIAHEIQNPLNFVNNFSEVNTELIEEMKNEIKAGNNEDAISIADDIKENEQKITHHGKRADSIVKGMLLHSQTSTGQKELTEINKLADEYLRLSYQGLRSKDKSFNAILNTDFDESIGKINIIPQDIGRALLNLYNNAFYVVSEKKKQQGENYQPTVSVSTKKSGDKVLVTVRDNGYGIPQKIVDKIFQPFFTTKPTGQGTGLGLSLSYDIIKAHGGEIKVESKEGEGAEFIIQLPVV